MIVSVSRRTDIPALLSISDVFVLPTLKDALPTVLIEALAAGTPIVASNVGGVPEIVQDGASGLLVPPEDLDELARACLKLLQDKSLASQVIQAGNEMVRNRFDINVQIGQLSRIYEEVSSQHGK